MTDPNMRVVDEVAQWSCATVIPLVCDIVTSAAAVFVAYLAYGGLNTWRAALIGKKEFDLAEEALALFYPVEDAIAAIRSALGHAGEGSRPVAVTGAATDSGRKV